MRQRHREGTPARLAGSGSTSALGETDVMQACQPHPCTARLGASRSSEEAAEHYGLCCQLFDLVGSTVACDAELRSS